MQIIVLVFTHLEQLSMTNLENFKILYNFIIKVCAGHTFRRYARHRPLQLIFSQTASLFTLADTVWLTYVI